MRSFGKTADGSPELFANRSETSQPGAAGMPAAPSVVSTRHQAITSTVAGTATTSSYAGIDNTIRATVGATNILTGPLGLQVTQTGPDTTAYIRTPAGALVAQHTPGGASQYYLTDNLGSVIGLVDAAGTRTAAYAYDPTGAVRATTGTAADANPYRYAAGHTDTTTGLVKFGARYYDPATGRFTQMDPSGQETNPYLYAASDPINRTDPTGRSAGACIGSAVIAVGAVIGYATGIETLGVGALVGVGIVALGSEIVAADSCGLLE